MHANLVRVFFFLFTLALVSRAGAQACPGSLPSGMDCVASGANKDITAFTICAKITNSHSSGKAIMAPINTATEWSEFRTKLPAGVTNTACGAPPPVPAVVQQASATSGTTATTSLGLTFPSNCTVGNWVIVNTFGRVSTDNITAMSGMGATWTKAMSGAQAGNHVEIWYGKCLTAGTAISITNSATDLRVNVGVEVSNLAGTVESLSSVNFSSTFQAGSAALTSTQNSFVIIAGVVDKQAAFSTTGSSSMAITHTHIATLDSGSGGSRMTGSAMYVVDTAPDGDPNGVIVWTGTGSPAATGIGASFK